MAGMFPEGGVAANLTANAQTDVVTTEGCLPLFHAARCTPRFDPVAANAIISEIANAVNVLFPYDCTKLDNLADVITAIRDICSIATNDVPDADDFLAGCFDGVTGKASISSILALKTICGFVTSNVPDLDDTVGMCVDGLERQVPLSAIRDLIVPDTPSVPGFLAVGSHIFGLFTNGGTVVSQNPGTNITLGGSNSILIYGHNGGFVNTTSGIWRLLGKNSSGDVTSLYVRVG